MEKYQMFFPCSSSVGISSADYPIPISTNAAEYHMGRSQVYNSFDGERDQSSNWFSGLRSSTDAREDIVNKDNQYYQYQQYSSSASASIIVGADQISSDHQNHRQVTKDSGKKNKGEKKMRNAKYAFQTRSQVDILDDGYRWRKYGQKAVKNNKFPR